MTIIKQIKTKTHIFEVIQEDSLKLGIRNIDDPKEYLLIDVTPEDLMNIMNLCKEYEEVSSTEQIEIASDLHNKNIEIHE